MPLKDSEKKLHSQLVKQLGNTAITSNLLNILIN